MLLLVLQGHPLTVGLRRITVFFFVSKPVVVAGRVAPYRKSKPQGAVMAHFITHCWGAKRAKQYRMPDLQTGVFGAPSPSLSYS